VTSRSKITNPEAIKIAQSDDERLMRIREITDEMRHLQEQKAEALRMKLREEVDAKTFRQVRAELDAAHDQLAREHNRLASEAAMPELPDPSRAWEDLSAEDRRTLTEMLIDKIVVAPHPHKIVDGRRHYTIRTIPYQDPQQQAARLKAGSRFAFVLGTPLCKYLHQVPLCLGQIKPVHSLGETQVCVDTGNDNACIYREQLNADKGHANVNIDHQTLVQDDVDDVRETARRGPFQVAIARLGCDGHEIELSSGPLIGRGNSAAS
jgi:hypothetical protein